MAAVAQSRPYYGVRSSKLRLTPRNVSLRPHHPWAELAVKQFLRALGNYRDELASDDENHSGWLLPFRNDFRLILRHRPCVGLRGHLWFCPPDDPVFSIAIWLLGRCATRQANYDLDQLPVGNSDRARRHLARALQQVEAWPRLRELVARYPEDRFLQRMLAGGSMRNFQRRITRFALHVDHSHEAEAAVASQMPLWIRDAEWTLSPPKPASWMRMILKRIRKWVRGE